MEAMSDRVRKATLQVGDTEVRGRGRGREGKLLRPFTLAQWAQ